MPPAIVQEILSGSPATTRTNGMNPPLSLVELAFADPALNFAFASILD